MSNVKQGQGRKDSASKTKYRVPPPKPPPLIVIREGAKYDPKKH